MGDDFKESVSAPTRSINLRRVGREDVDSVDDVGEMKMLSTA